MQKDFQWVSISWDGSAMKPLFSAWQRSSNQPGLGPNAVPQYWRE
jgi:hypothetical protein